MKLYNLRQLRAGDTFRLVGELMEVLEINMETRVLVYQDPQGKKHYTTEEALVARGATI